MGNIVNAIEDRIQNAILAALDSIKNPIIELDFRSINASSVRDATIMASSERGEYIGFTAPLEKRILKEQLNSCVKNNG